MRAAFVLVVGAALALRGAPPVLHAQSPTSSDLAGSPATVRDSLAVPAPFGPGERMEFQVKLGIFGTAGEGWIGVDSLETVDGHPTYRLSMGIDAGKFGLSVKDDYRSWLDTRLFVSRHFVTDVHEVSYKQFKDFVIHPEERRWEQIDEKGKFGTMKTGQPLDELGYIFWLRTLDLRVGEEYTSERYFKDEGNPVVIRVLRKEVKEVPAGKFNTIVVQPIIRTKGLFSQGGKAEIYLSDDAERRIVYLKTSMPGPGDITLHLKRFTPGTPLNPGPPVQASAGR